MRPLCMYTGDAEAPIYQWLVEQGVEVIQVRLNLASLHALPARPRAQEWCVRGALTAARPPAPPHTPTPHPTRPSPRPPG